MAGLVAGPMTEQQWQIRSALTRGRGNGDAGSRPGPLSVTGASGALAALVGALGPAVRTRRPTWQTVDAVSDAVAPFLGQPDVLAPEQRIGDPTGYRQHLLHVPDDGAYSLVALVWLPGQCTPVHDHVAWCVVGVHEGEEHETRYRRVGDRLVEDGRTVSRRGSVSGLLPPGDIHRVSNDGAELAVSLHVYGADLRERGTSIRRRYDLPIARPVRWAA